MRSRRQRLLAACVMLAASVQICAAGNPAATQGLRMRPAVVDWQGAYGGLLFSVSSFKAGITGLDGTPDKVEGRGRLAGIVAGYNLQENQWVYGVEADIGYGQLRTLKGNARLKADLVATLRARLGRDFDGNILFGTAGIALAGINQSSALMVNGDNSVDIGWIIGGGLEHAFARQLTGRIEYLYARNMGNKTTGQRDSHMLRAGAVYHLPN